MTDFLLRQENIRNMLASNDIRAALIYLNLSTAYRFTSMYRFDDYELLNMYFVDKMDLFILATDDVPVTSSYCAFLRDGQIPFLVTDSLIDERVAHHPKRKTVRSYCGVPLFDNYGKLFGSVCHYDFEPVYPNAIDVDLLEAVGMLLRKPPQFLQRARE
jgi:GAF domain-containing protein